MNLIPLLFGIGFARFAPVADDVKGVVLVMSMIGYAYTRTHWTS